MTTSNAVPKLSLMSIARIESEFLTSYSYEHSEFSNQSSDNMQSMLLDCINYSFSDKVSWLADRPGIYNQAKSYFSAKRESRLK